MQDAFKQKLADYGAWTYRGAWALEISAAVLGLATGITLGYQGFNSADPSSVTSVDLVLASAPFFMVAIAELTKIPISTLLFSASWTWKPIVFLFLLALAGITFETVFMGLERAATLRQLRYEDIVNHIRGLEFERDQIERRVSDAKASVDLQKSKDNYDLTASQLDQDRAKILNAIKDVEREVEGQRALLPGSARLRDAIAEKSSAREKLVEKREAAVKEAVVQFERQRDSYVQRINDARRAGDLDAAKRYDDDLRKLPNPKSRVEAQYQPQITQIESEILSARAEVDRLQKTAPPMSAAEKQQLESKREDLRSKLNAFDLESEQKLAAARRLIAATQNLEMDRLGLTQNEQKRKDGISAELTPLEAKRIETARTDQVRRIAARFFGLRPEQVDDDQAGTVSLLWFGSLAMLAALAGPLTAIVALNLQRIGAGERQPETRLSRLLRASLLKWRWRRVKTVFVPVETFIEKEVEKRVEVPVETIVKEILYVPVLTDDPEALRRVINDSLPREIADLVKMSFAGREHAS